MSCMVLISFSHHNVLIIGVVWVNIAAKKGWVVKDKMDSAASSVLSIRAGGVYPTDNRPIAGVQTVSPDSIDALAWHLAVIGIAMLIGYVIKVVFIAIEGTSVALQDVGFLSGFPLFPLCMCGGIMIQLGLERFNRDHKLVDARLMERLSGTSLDFLITAAVASVNMSAIGANIVPFFILILSGVFWHFFAIGLLARHFLPNHWFERSIAEFGMTMGIIASGLVLLRMVDPESKSPVAADFAYKQLLHSPFMGGGIWTCLSLPLLAKAGIWVSFVVVGIVFIGWVLLGLFVMKPKYEMHCACNVCSNLGAGDPIYASSSHSLNGGSGSVVSSDGRRSGSGREISTSVSLGEPLLRGDGSDDIAASTDRVSNMESLVRSSDMMIESKQEQLRENRTFSHDSNGL